MLRVNRVVMVLGVGGVDGDERHFAPILAPFHAGGLRAFGLRNRLLAKHMRHVVHVQSDQRDRLLVVDRPQPLSDFCACAKAPGAQHVHRHKIAVARVCFLARRDDEFAVEAFLVDGQQAPAALRESAKHAHDLRARALDQLDDPPAIFGRAFLSVFVAINAKKCAVANSGNRLSGLWLARRPHCDARGRAV